MKINGTIRLEKFIFQNSQYVFSKEKKSNKFIIAAESVYKEVTIEGIFDNTDTFVKKFNEIMNSQSLPIRISYSNILYEIKILIFREKYLV